MKQRARIEDWRVETLGDFKYMSGRVEGHPRQDEFHVGRVNTSELLRLDIVTGQAETQNTLYELGKAG